MSYGRSMEEVHGKFHGSTVNTSDLAISNLNGGTQPIPAVRPILNPPSLGPSNVSPWRWFVAWAPWKKVLISIHGPTEPSPCLQLTDARHIYSTVTYLYHASRMCPFPLVISDNGLLEYDNADGGKRTVAPEDETTSLRNFRRTEWRRHAAASKLLKVM